MYWCEKSSKPGFWQGIAGGGEKTELRCPDNSHLKKRSSGSGLHPHCVKNSENYSAVNSYAIKSKPRQHTTVPINSGSYTSVRLIQSRFGNWCPVRKGTGSQSEVVCVAAKRMVYS